MRSFSVCCAVILGLLLLSCTAEEPLEFADWTIEVPEGTRVVEYQNVTGWDRGGEIELEKDLVIGNADYDANYALYRPRGVDVDEEGNIYVLDAGNNRVQVFDGNGKYLRTLGRQGEGPGEFKRPFMIAVAGNRVGIADQNKAMFSLWTTGGEHIEDHRVEWTELRPELLAGLPGGSFLIKYILGQRLDPTIVVARWSSQVLEEHRYVEREQKIGIGRKGVAQTPSGALMGGIMLPSPKPWVANAAGNYYLMLGDEYQVLALNHLHEPRWALRVAAEKRPFPEGYVEDGIRNMRRSGGGSDLSVSDFEDWRPEFFPVLELIQVDGHGHLYVFPFQDYEPKPPDDETEVDVYSADGERLFTGSMPRIEWEAAFGDYVYMIETDEATREQVVVRYRLVEPI